MPDAFAALKNLVQATHPLPEEDWPALSAFWKPYNTRPKETITAAGEKEKYLYFVAGGSGFIFWMNSTTKPPWFLRMRPFLPAFQVLE